MNKVIPIPINGNYWRQLLDIMDFSKPYGFLDGREKDVLAALLSYNWKYKDMSKKEKNILIFNPATKRDICEMTGMSSEVLHNKLTSLKQKGIIEKDESGNHIVDYVANFMQEYESITFKFVNK